MSLPRLIVPKRHPDARGWFAETFNEARLRALGIDCPFVQDNQSYSQRAGTLARPAFPGAAVRAGQADQRAARPGSRCRGRCAPRLADLRQTCVGGIVGRNRPPALHSGRLCARRSHIGERRRPELQSIGILRGRLTRAAFAGTTPISPSPGRSRRAPSRSPRRIAGFPC